MCYVYVPLQEIISNYFPNLLYQLSLHQQPIRKSMYPRKIFFDFIYVLPIEWVQSNLTVVLNVFLWTRVKLNISLNIKALGIFPSVKYCFCFSIGLFLPF